LFSALCRGWGTTVFSRDRCNAGTGDRGYASANAGAITDAAHRERSGCGGIIVSTAFSFCLCF
jgi:hypothetical protein